MLTVLTACLLCIPQEPVPFDPPVSAQIRLPAIVEPPSPTPVEPQQVTKLEADLWYVIDSDIPLIALSSPDGIVTITRESGPLRLRGKFVDGKGVETRSYAGPHIYIVEAAKKGITELLLVPQGATEDSDVIRRTLTVMGGGPQPPPPDPDDPDPPTPPGPTTSFRVIFVKESGQLLSPEQTAIPGAKVIRDYLNRKCTAEDGQPGWREFDPQFAGDNEPAIMKSLWQAVKPKIQQVPCIVIEINGTVTVKQFPANVAETMAVLKKAGGE